MRNAKINLCTLITSFFVFVVLAGVNRADYRLFDDFEDKLPGSIGGQDGWVSGSSAIEVVPDPAAPDNQILCVPSESSILRKPLKREYVGVLNNTARMMFLRLRISQKQTFSMGLSPLTAPSEYSDFAPEIGMANSAHNLDLRVWDDDGSNYKVLTQLAADRWYNVWIWIDAAQNNYQMWLNDVPGSGAAPADKLAAADSDEIFDFRFGTNSNLITFYIKTAGGSSGVNFGPIYIDDIYLELSDTLNLSNPTGTVPPIPGDANRDGRVNLADFAMMAAHWAEGPIPAALWEEGNFDYDDAVTLGDVELMALYWLYALEDI
jgi:hypothetical protein